MLYRKLDYSAFMLSKHCHLLPLPALLWAGDRQNAVFAFSPVNRFACFTTVQLQSFIEKEINTAPASIAGQKNAFTEEVFATKEDNKGWHSFRSGWLGYFSYEAGHALMSGGNRIPNMPLAEFFEYEFSIVLNFVTDECELVCRPEVDTDKVIQELESILTPNKATQESKAAVGTHATAVIWSAAWNAQQYQQAFTQVQAYLKSGDCYQVNLAMPFSTEADMRNNSPLPLLQSFNPAFGGYLKSEHLSLYSVSPERFICIDGERMETRPIKGTVSRGANIEEDEANKAWLAVSKKNQAENLMIVDLLRNDLSRYALPFSVKVEKLFAIETHANVHHMVSTISANKRPEISSAEVIVNALPGGSITGAPKKRAMEVINELEASPRGPYCGVLGFFDDSGFVDFNILIRTVVAKEDGAQVWAGGGVVLDSTCEEEWQELHVKVARILEQFGEA